MLKALELIGFKSFADKTRFEFPPGITVIVGPNGSGKSNIVDAIKWVLGEQSAKSLRGKDMADVIFKGSAAGGRKAMNTAEATITFDNSSKQLAVDAPEVHVTRRIYRSGEGEYMINGQPCRLRDIKDLFSGTGVGTDAYSLIEQGKVDVLLQASPRDRRAIFEEAAGISRFKAKKIEAQRRLDRADQNLLRLSDVVEEVDSRLRSVRAQAAKARHYKEYSDRLQELRTQVGLADWRVLTEKIQALDAELGGLRWQADDMTAQIDAVETQSNQMVAQSKDVDESLRDCESQIARDGEHTASHQSTVQHERQRHHDLIEQASRHSKQLASMEHRVKDLQCQLQETVGGVAKAQAEYQENRQVLTRHDHKLIELTTTLVQLRSENETLRNEQVRQMRQAATLGNRISAVQSQLDSASAASARCRGRLESLERESATQAELLDQLEHKQEQIELAAERKKALLDTAKRELDDSRRQLASRQQALAELEGQHAGASERADLLEQLERTHEGLNAGVQEILAQVRGDHDGPFHSVCGLVADLLRAGVESAPMVDVALGEFTQYAVLRDSKVLDHLQAGAYRLPGRVGFVQINATHGPCEAGLADLDGQEGVLGRADRYVDVDPPYLPLVKRLLGGTWFVQTLSRAFELSQSTGRGLRFVTVAGELLTEDGTLVVGPQQQAAGLITRRSELRALQQKIVGLVRQIGQTKQEVTQLQNQVAENDRRAEQLNEDHHRTSQASSDHRGRIQAAQQRKQQLQQQHATIVEELWSAEEQCENGRNELSRIRQKRDDIDQVLVELEAKILDGNERIEQHDVQRQQYTQDVTSAKIQLAKSGQRLEALGEQQNQLEQDQKERVVTVAEAREQLDLCGQRRQQAERNILKATSAVAELYLDMETLSAQAEDLVDRRDQIHQQRDTLSEQVQTLRKRLHKQEELRHEKQLKAGEIHHQRSALADRLREDYDIELAELQQEPSAEEQHQREAVDTEITTLRRKISNIGAVNMDALEELEELAARHGCLMAQHHDLTEAKASLDKIIEKINVDSRRLFVETLQAIRENFQTLFRKVFGGGHADIVLEEGVDVLESGVEIVATPPGKHSLSISLLSGGEKALSAVTLLLAIFQFRPSPFCVLDEVDSPLDEANIGRFLESLKGFLGWTKFVIVTHSKKTMSSASTLYGVTMQESGVSKRVSVQFDDVSETGQIRHKVLEREVHQTAEDVEDERGAA